MREIAAHAFALAVALMRGTCCTRVRVSELDALVHVIADRLHTRPARGCARKQAPRELGHVIGIAIAAA